MKRRNLFPATGKLATPIRCTIVYSSSLRFICGQERVLYQMRPILGQPSSSAPASILPFRCALTSSQKFIFCNVKFYFLDLPVPFIEKVLRLAAKDLTCLHTIKRQTESQATAKLFHSPTSAFASKTTPGHASSNVRFL